MKSIGKVVAGAAAIAAVVWVGLYLYWHVKISGALSTLKTQYPPAIIDKTVDPLKGEAFETLSGAGCRSLHALAGALDSGNNPELMYDAFFRIFSAQLPPPAGDPDAKAQLQFLEDNRVFLSDNAERRREKVARVQAWWKENAPRYHQDWRLWSSKCAGDR
ncbi:MAG TPA: hypothetical protein VNM14_06210 [Planctomycetota bacterium]|jgi:hypothetical protein|nr:hypothetical protein [Planctomycetota bacterium]